MAAGSAYRTRVLHLAHNNLSTDIRHAATQALGVSAPISFSMNGDVADAIELQSGQRVVGTLVATVNFASKVGSGLTSAVVGAVLALSGSTAAFLMKFMGWAPLPAGLALLLGLLLERLLARIWPAKKSAEN